MGHIVYVWCLLRLIIDVGSFYLVNLHLSTFSLIRMYIVYKLHQNNSHVSFIYQSGIFVKM